MVSKAVVLLAGDYPPGDDPYGGYFVLVSGKKVGFIYNLGRMNSPDWRVYGIDLGKCKKFKSRAAAADWAVLHKPGLRKAQRDRHCAATYRGI